MDRGVGGCEWMLYFRAFLDRLPATRDGLAAPEASIPESWFRCPCHTWRMATDGTEHVTLSGDRSGEYVVMEERPDGSLDIRGRPDTSADAILRRQNITPAKLKEFETEYGPIQPPDGEG